MHTPREIFERYQHCVLHKDWQSFGDLFAEDGVIEFPFALPGVTVRREGREVIRNAAREAGVGSRYSSRSFVRWSSTTDATPRC